MVNYCCIISRNSCWPIYEGDKTVRKNHVKIRFYLCISFVI